MKNVKYLFWFIQSKSKWEGKEKREIRRVRKNIQKRKAIKDGKIEK